LFTIRQGVRTGLKAAFVLSKAELARLPKSERNFFRPSAGQGSIERGTLSASGFVFYPYSPGGLIIGSEAELRRELPEYYSNWLAPFKSRLKKRQGIQKWWLPTRPREWQYEEIPKIVSTYFGGAGSFAYDAGGEYAVVDGFAWILRGSTEASANTEETNLTYLAIVNSRVFERILSCFSWRLQGGQLRLEARFLNDIPFPTIDQLQSRSPSLPGELSALGRSITQGKLDTKQAEIDALVRVIFAFPTEP
jgi:hypothetical protein